MTYIHSFSIRYHPTVQLGQGCNQRWSLDFVSDALTCGRRFRIFAVVDDFSRECANYFSSCGYDPD